MVSGLGPSLSLAAVLLESQARWRWHGGIAWWSARTEVAASGSLPKIWATRAPYGLGRAEITEFMVLPRGGDGDFAWLGWQQGRHVAAGLSELYGPIWARLSQCGPGVLLVFCSADDHRSVVEVGSSHPAELLSHVLVLSCILTL
jgi:hypothetical protein